MASIPDPDRAARLAEIAAMTLDERRAAGAKVSIESDDWDDYADPVPDPKGHATYTVHERYDANESFVGGVDHIKTWFVACTQTTIDDEDSESGEDVHIPLCTTIGERKEADRLVALLNRGAALFLMAQRIIAEGTDPSLVAEARKALGWEDPAVSDECKAGRCANCWDDACPCPLCGHPGGDG